MARGGFFGLLRFGLPARGFLDQRAGQATKLFHARIQLALARGACGNVFGGFAQAGFEHSGLSAERGDGFALRFDSRGEIGSLAHGLFDFERELRCAGFELSDLLEIEGDAIFGAVKIESGLAFNADGSSLALFYCDYFKRDNKQGGAWMSNFVEQSRLLGTKPVVINVANFAQPAPGEPALLTSDDVRTMFHEFGHGLHGMFSDAEYPTLSGTSTARDFVEFPSQFNEYWGVYPAVFQHYAKHYKTGAPMPADLAEKIKKSDKFNKGYDVTELVAAAELDMKWHTLPPSAPLEQPDQFERQALEKIHLWISYVPPRYRSSYFAHIWSNDYAAGYYAYLWTQMLADDAYQNFEDHGGLTRANGDRFRQMVLSRGNTEDLEQLYEAWRGAKPSIEPMLKQRGLEADPGH